MDFALIMFVLLVVTGGIWLLDRYALAARRGGEVAEPWWVEYAKSFFPVILIVFFIRSFLVEPFKIPSGSMIPTLQVGDFILVNKFTYGIRLPIINHKLVQLNDPQRGDVMVFHYPENPSLDYIKRIVAISGDSVEYRNKRLWINGVEQAQQAERLQLCRARTELRAYREAHRKVWRAQACDSGQPRDADAASGFGGRVQRARQLQL